MITVRELYNTMLFFDGERKTVGINFDGGSIDVDLNNTISMTAYGDFIVGSIMATGDDRFEIGIAMRPVKPGEVRV